MATTTPLICLVPWQDELLIRTMDIDFHGTRTTTSTTAYINLSSELSNLVPPPSSSSSSSSSTTGIRYISPLTDPNSQIMDIILMHVLSSQHRSSHVSPLRMLFQYLQRIEAFDYGKNLPYAMEQLIHKAKVTPNEVQTAFKKMMGDLARYAVLAITDYSMFDYDYSSTVKGSSTDNPISSVSGSSVHPNLGKSPWSSVCSPSHYELFTGLVNRTLPSTFIPMILQQYTTSDIPAYQTTEIQQIFIPVLSELLTRLTMVNTPSDTPQEDIDDSVNNAGNSPFRAFLHDNMTAAEAHGLVTVVPVDDNVHTKFRGGLRTMPSSVPSASVSVPKPNLSSRLASFPGPTLLRQETFVPYLTILDQLLSYNDLLHLLLNDNDSNGTGNGLWGWNTLSLPNPLRTPPSSSASSSSSVPSSSLPTGKDIEQRTCLGRILSLGPQAYDFITIDGQDLLDAAVDIKQLTDDSLPEIPDNASSPTPSPGTKLYGFECTAFQRSQLPRGIQRILPVIPASSQELLNVYQTFQSSLKQTHTLLREGILVHRRLTSSIVTRFAKVKHGREALFCWMGRLIDSNSLRSSLAFTACQPNANTVKVSSGALLYNSLHAMINLCLPFIDPTDPKHARIDPRYMTTTTLVPNGNGGGRFRTDKEERVAPFVDYEDSEGDNEDSNSANNASHTASWLDARNLARQQQFKQQQAALMKRAKLEASVQTPPRSALLTGSSNIHDSSTPSRAGSGSIPGNRKYTEPLAWHNITEIFWLTIRLANIGYLSSCSRQENLYSSIERARDQYKDAYEVLQQASQSTGDLSPTLKQAYAQWLYGRNRGLRSLIGTKYITETWLFDMNAVSVDPLMQLYRSLAVHLLRIVTPYQAKYVPGMSDDTEYIFTATNATNPANASTKSTVVPPTVPSSSSSPAQSTVPSFLPLPEPRLPLPPPTALYCGLPAFLIHDIGEFFMFLQRSPLRRNLFESTYFSPSVARDILIFILTFLASPLYVANPYDRGKLVQALSVFVPGRYDRWREATLEQSKPPLHTLIGTDSLAIQYTLPSLVSFHVDIGISGSHTGFYDKFNYRHTSSDILIYLWQLSLNHRQTLIQYANSPETGPNSFLRFASELINDSDYHLGEALKALEEIRTMEKKLDDHENGTRTLTPPERQETEKNLRGQENMARGSLRYATEQILVLSLLTTGITHVWLTRNLRDRIASCLGYYLDQLCGSKRTNLRIKNMDKVGFKPREVLLRLISIYNNLAVAGPRAGAEKDEGGTMWITNLEKDTTESLFMRSLTSTASNSSTISNASSVSVSSSGTVGDTDILANAIIRDERSFHIENFTNAQQILADPRFVTEHPSASTEVQRLESLITRLRTAFVSKQELADDLGEIPDELTDPLLSDLMSDPVLIPTSRMVVQRDSIEHSLLNEERDPYNRMYLTKSMLIELPLLKQAIHGWINARRQKQEDKANEFVQEVIRLKEDEPRQLLGLTNTPSKQNSTTEPPPKVGKDENVTTAAMEVEKESSTGGSNEISGRRDDAMDSTIAPLNTTNMNGNNALSVTVTPTTVRNEINYHTATDLDENDDDLAAALALSLADEEQSDTVRTPTATTTLLTTTANHRGGNTVANIPGGTATNTVRNDMSDDDLAMAIWLSLSPEEQIKALGSNTTGFQPPPSSSP